MMNDDLFARVDALAHRHFALAEQLAVTIARSRCLTVECLIAKAELLRELTRPGTMGADQAERYIIEALPSDIRRVFARMRN